MSCPETREELVDWFTRDPQRMPIEDIELLADRMIGTNRGRFHFLHEPEGMSVTEVWNMILEYDFLLSDRYGWLDRKGKLWGCSWAAHEKLLDVLGHETKDVERLGWVRVTRTYLDGWKSVRKINMAQRRTLKRMGLEVSNSEESTKPAADRS